MIKHTTAILALLLILASPYSLHAETSAEWLAKIDKAERVEQSWSTIEQTITTSTGAIRTLKAENWSAANGDLSLLIYTAPARVKGDKILQRDGGDNIWYYMKRRDVTRHFTGTARRQKAMGSDFSYQDLAQGTYTEDFTATLLDDQKLNDEPCAVLHCVPTESGPNYEHLVIFASRNDNLSRKIEYYDEKGLLKTLVLSGFKMVNGRKLATKMVMTNARTGSSTIMETKEISLQTDIDLNLFTQRALSDTRSKR